MNHILNFLLASFVSFGVPSKTEEPQNNTKKTNNQKELAWSPKRSGGTVPSYQSPPPRGRSVASAAARTRAAVLALTPCGASCRGSRPCWSARWWRASWSRRAAWPPPRTCPDRRDPPRTAPGPPAAGQGPPR